MTSARADQAEGSASHPGGARRAVDDDLRAIGGAVAWARDLAAKAGVPADVVYAMEVGLEEALANLILHGRTDGGPKAITLGFHARAGDAVAVISDCCRPFDAATAAVPAAPTREDMVEGGQGLRLLRAFAAEVVYESDGDGNHLTLVFRPASPAGRA
jgi:anti-sigma regulatory factor (Ser/Thr protein kinase)